MSERVITTVENRVAHVRMNRPEKHNGLDLGLFEGLVAAGVDLMGRTDVRAVVLSGEGPSFCAGLDFMAFMMTGDEGQQKMLRRDSGSPANVAQRAAWVWTEVPVPVIAAIHGACYGGGCQIALGADMRYVRPDARMSVMEIKWGLIPDMSITKTLPRLVGIDVAKELMYTGRVVSGEEARSLGLATRVCDDPVAAAMETALLIASKNPNAIRHGKRLMDEAPGLPVPAAFRLETALQIELLGSPNQLEAVKANMEKRDPAFADPE